MNDLFRSHCLACHGEDGAGGLDLREPTQIVDRFAEGAYLPLVSSDGRLEDSYLWHKVRGTQGRVGGGGAVMPPNGRLDEDSLAVLQTWIEAGGQCEGGPLPARPPAIGRPQPVPIRRLNRFELDRTVRDLLGTAIRPSTSLPADDTVAGFDTLGEALTLSELHVEQLERVAEQIAQDFVERMEPGGPVVRVLDPQQMNPSNGAPVGDGWMLWSNGTLWGTVDLPLPGTYSIEVRAWGDQVPPDPVQMAVMVDGPVLTTFDVPNPQPYLSYMASIDLDAGEHELAVAFLNDLYDPGVPNGDRNLVVESVVIRLESAADPIYERHRHGLTCVPEEEGATTCLRALFEPLMERAYRRPAENGEVERLVAVLEQLAEEGMPWREVVVAGVQAVLLSPHFLFKPEIGGPDGSLTDHELATRLSYFLWSSMPDDALRARADAGELTDPAVLEAEVRRMLADPRAEALVESFGGQWLWLRRIEDGAPDPSRYPEVDDALRDSFREQARRMVEDALLGPEPVASLLTRTDHAIDSDLARFYGYPGGVSGWAVVDLAFQGRVGLLSNGGLLAALSNPTRSNPTRRGRWMMSQLLCDSPGEPPPGAVAGFDPGVGEGSLRERFEAHRSDPVCASCHDLMDPLGFSLEGFGPAGERREVDDLGYPVDSSGVLPDGRSFQGPAGLAALLADDPIFTRCVVEQTFIYALGRRMDRDTDPYVRDVHERFVAGGGFFDDLVVGLVLSDAFRRRGP